MYDIVKLLEIQENRFYNSYNQKQSPSHLDTLKHT